MDSKSEYNSAQVAASYLLERCQQTPLKAVVSGSGISTVFGNYDLISTIPFSDVPHMGTTTFHKGDFLLLRYPDSDTVFLGVTGRLHYYEGFTAKEIAFPIRVMALMGIKEVLMTNATGGLNPSYQAGEIVLIKDHINLLPDHPLRGANDERFGIRFPDMLETYSKELRKTLSAKWLEGYGTPISEGVYAAFQGPSLETPAEYNMLHILGADVVGMSTVPEVIVAHHVGIKVAVLSIVTNVCYPIDNLTSTSLEDVIAVAESALPKLKIMVDGFLER